MALPPTSPAREEAPLIGLAQLMQLAYDGADLAPLGRELILRAGGETNDIDANALFDLSTVLQLRGDHDLALQVQGQALAVRQCFEPPTAATPGALRVLALMAQGDLMANTPIEFMLRDADVALTVIYVGTDLPLPERVPEHDVLFVAIGESERNLPLLAQVNDAVRRWPRPVVNRPDAIAALARDQVYATFADAPGMHLAPTVRLGRTHLEAVAAGMTLLEAVFPAGVYPIIVRPLDSHAGNGLERVADAAALATYLESRPESAFFASNFVDYRGADGWYRKYRVVLMQGEPQLCHLALSEHWMVHYLNAGMNENLAKRTVEARSMANFDSDFARRHADAFRTIYARTGLDYVGIDCSELPDGRLMVFEVDSNMIVHSLDPEDVFPYKKPHMTRVFAAFERFLRAAAAPSA